MRAPILLLLLLGTAACWQPRYFAPRENLNGSGPDGNPAAVYSLPAATPGAVAGELRLWSRGAKAHYDKDNADAVELHIGFELENTGTDLLRLDLSSITCEELQIDGLLQSPLEPVRFEGDGVAPPGSTARVEAFFEPATSKPRHIDSFAIRFRVERADGTALSQVTPFGPLRPVDYYDSRWHDPYWRDPYWGSWSVGFGAGWGWGGGWHHHYH